MDLKIILFVLIICLIDFINSARVYVSTEGPGVIDLPMTFVAKLTADMSLEDKFVYIFEDNGMQTTHREEMISGREADYTITYGSDVKTGSYQMKVQVYSYIWGFRGWLMAENTLEFKLEDTLSGALDISQSDVPVKALMDSFVAINRTVEMSAQLKGDSKYFKNASISYTWVLDSRTFGPNPSPDLNYTFTQNKTFRIFVAVVCNITKVNKTITKLGQISRTLNVRNPIKAVNVIGNTWLLDGALLQLQVNCTTGDPTFHYCYEFSRTKRPNYTCDTDMYTSQDCSFRITRYLPKNGSYYIDIAVSNDVDFKNKTIVVNVYDIVRQTQLSFVIIPIVSSILAIAIVVVGIAYHLQQRQRYNITLEVADFDFQHNEDLMEKTFFERLRESLATALRDTVLYPCNPCTRPQNYDDFIDDSFVDQSLTNNNSAGINTNPISYGIVK